LKCYEAHGLKNNLSAKFCLVGPKKRRQNFKDDMISLPCYFGCAFDGCESLGGSTEPIRSIAYSKTRKHRFRKKFSKFSIFDQKMAFFWS